MREQGVAREGEGWSCGACGPGRAGLGGSSSPGSAGWGLLLSIKLKQLSLPQLALQPRSACEEIRNNQVCFLLRVVEVAKPTAGESGQQTAGTHFSPLFCSFPPSAAWRMGCCANNCPCRERILCWWLQSLSQTQRSSVLPLNPLSWDRARAIPAEVGKTLQVRRCFQIPPLWNRAVPGQRGKAEGRAQGRRLPAALPSHPLKSSGTRSKC